MKLLLTTPLDTTTHKKYPFKHRSQSVYVWHLNTGDMNHYKNILLHSIPNMLQTIKQEIFEIETAVSDASSALESNTDDNISPIISYWTLQLGSIFLV